MKKLISCLSAVAVLITATAIAPATTAADLPVLKADSVLMMTRDGSAVCGTNGVITAADLAAEFDEIVAVKDPAGNVIDGETKVPTGSTVSTEGGSVGVLVSGDASMDGSINLTDVSTMLKQIAGWTVTVDTAAADVDNTGKINLSDVSTVLKFIAGWDVKLGYKKIIVDEEPQTAANEDADTVLWFEHSTEKLAQADTKSSGKNTYVIYAAKNEIEDANV
ncbi:MAG: dockerin type I repeat-containing protein, partial [Clostridia bacterium]|nr:dockerin type I repeat-containing protein [Clostridia bacterium]